MAAAAAAGAAAGSTVGQIAGSVVGGAALGTASGLFKPSIKRQWKYQQRAMALQQQYALEQMNKQAELQYANWQKQFDYENAYNDPTKVMERFRKAGISPAAALGQSGVSIGATLSGGSPGSVGASGPSAGPMDFSNPFSGTPAAVLESLTTQSAIRRNEAASARDYAEANKLKGDTHSDYFRSRMDELTLKGGDLENQNLEQIRNINEAKSVIMQNDAELATITFGYRFESVAADLQILKDRAKILRDQAPALSRQAEASYLATLAIAFYHSEMAQSETSRRYLMSKQADLTEEQSRLTETQVADMKNQFDLDWNREFEVPVFDKKGNVTETHKLTLREMYAYMTQAEAGAASYKSLDAFYNMRSERHKLLYGILLNLSALGFGAAGAYMTKGKSLQGQFEMQQREHDFQREMNTYHELDSENKGFYGPNGEYRGSVVTTKSRKKFKK